VEVDRLGEGLCGRSRPGHFRGVATVVAKLFNIVEPDIAYFGQKDAQQAVIIKRMASDLDMAVSIKVVPTVRDADGLALSSRNRYLTPGERRDAGVLYQALLKAKRLVEEGERQSEKIIEAMRKLIEDVPSARVDYIAIVHPETMEEIETIESQALVALAVYIGKTRLIDNMVVKPG
jgi:pantoate--beta-alanine ligase